MPHPITIPRLGWSMEEGVLTEWLKAPRDLVRAGDMLFILEGEKAAIEIESLDSGYLCVPADAPQPGATVKVGEVIGFLLADGEAAPNSVRVLPTTPVPVAVPHRPASDPITTMPAPSVASSSATVLQATPRAAGPAARRLARELGIDLNAVVTPDPTGRVLVEDIQRAANVRDRQSRVGLLNARPIATPRARRRSRELGVDWTRLTGTGRNGRIRERDVLIAQSGFATQPTTDTELSAPSASGRHAPASKLRQIIAQRLSAGVHQAVPVTLTTKINAESLFTCREQLKAAANDGNDGLVPTYNDILLYHAAQTLRELPVLNACWHRNGVYSYDDIHIATAVDTPDGLLAPVVRNADRLTLHEIANQTRDLIAATRSGRVNQNQLSGGTFTITNLGMFGIDSFTPILNLPQAAILGIGRIVEEPVVKNRQIVVGKSMGLCLTFDHRVVDGAPASRWLQRLCERLQACDHPPGQ